MNGFTGMPVMTSRLLEKRTQVRFSRMKRRRLVKKFARDPRNWKVEPDERVYIMQTPQGRVVVCHPAMVGELNQDRKAGG